MASTRLRKTFHYPADEDIDDDLDEEHQEQLITQLQTEDAAKSTTYRLAFLSIPLSGALYFVYAFAIASTPRERMLALMSLSSLACTAYILHFMPIENPDRKGKNAVYMVEAAKSPVEKNLPMLNVILAGLLLVAAVVSWRRRRGQDAWREALPMSKADVMLGGWHRADRCHSHISADHVCAPITRAFGSRGVAESEICLQRRIAVCHGQLIRLFS